MYNKLILCFFLLLLGFYSFAQEEKKVETYTSFDTFDKEVLSRDDGYTYVVNFWATWCSPCVKELPYFYNIDTRFEGEKVRTILVSLDFKRQINSRLIPFLQKHNIDNEVVVLLDGDANTWIDAIDKNWSGAIPYTLVYRGKKKIGVEKSFHSEEEIDNFIKSL